MQQRIGIAFGAGALALALALAFAPTARANSAPPPGEAEARYRALLAEADHHAGEPDRDYALGVAAEDAGHYGEAIIAFQRALAVRPDFAQARAELARSYALSGDIDTARAQFATVIQDPTLPDPVRQRFTGLVNSLERQIRGGGSTISGFLEAGAGHDSNINAATTLTSVTIPLFAALGPGTLGAGARARGDGFGEITGGLSAVAAIGRQDRVFASALGDYRDNFHSSAFDQASLTGTVGLAHSLANQDVLSASAQVQKFWLGQAGYRTSYGAIGQFTHLLPGGRALSVSVQVNRLDYDTDPLKDSNRYAIGVGYVTRRLSANLFGGHEEARRPGGDANSNSFAGASLGAELPLARRVAFIGGAAFSYARYDAPDALFLVRREDKRVDLSAGIKLQLVRNLYLQPRVTYTRNWSNIALYDHRRVTAAGTVRLEF